MRQAPLLRAQLDLKSKFVLPLAEPNWYLWAKAQKNTNFFVKKAT